jgi:hypothetical protein
MAKFSAKQTFCWRGLVLDVIPLRADRSAQLVTARNSDLQTSHAHTSEVDEKAINREKGGPGKIQEHANTS